MLEVTATDIETLNDTDLRSLIALLCESEMIKLGNPTSGVTWGGHQNAKDGGVDVRVQYYLDSIEGYVPRNNTCFQVKKPDMPRGAIIDEMSPKGQLRSVIKQLIDLKGAYIIVSSQGSTADSALIERKETMRDVVSKFDINGQLLVDFYDRQRVASWVSQHPSLMAWVRKKVGREIQGWRSYDNWSNCPSGIDEEYLIDDQDVRLVKKFYGSKHLSIETGLNEIREQLLKPSSIVRLIGLSGVGKTRFVQALFDERVGIKALSTTQALYTDVSESPNPSPKQVLEELIIQKQQAILIVDNCAPELHKSLTEVLKASKSSGVSLLTIEYDVREEHSEETEIYAFEPACEKLISKVIQTRYPDIDNGGSWHIAKLSGGNFRIANALASVVNKGENISLLSDKNLFSRLFKQRNDHDNSLEVAAEVCSLVYSFNSDTRTGENLEITLLSELVEMSTRQLYRHLGELKSRELVQSRGYFRAILPHALANRLAASALEKVPMYDIKETFEVKADWRLFRSFAKRLSYLHSSELAIKIAKKWTEDQGILENLMPIDEKKNAPIRVLSTTKSRTGFKSFGKS